MKAKAKTKRRTTNKLTEREISVIVHAMGKSFARATVAKIEALTSKVKATPSARVDAMEAKLAGFAKAVDKLTDVGDDAVDRFYETVDKRIDAVEARMGRIEKRLRAVEQSVGAPAPRARTGG